MRTLLGIGILVLSLCWESAWGQARKEKIRLIKTGGMLFFHEGSYHGFSLHVEYEIPFFRNVFLTSGPRLDYVSPKTAHGTTILGYELKFYPLAKLMSKPCQGLVIGIDAIYVIRGDSYHARYGPGAGAILGYQLFVGRKLSLLLEASPLYMKDINDKSIQYNSERGYRYAFACLKVGYTL